MAATPLVSHKGTMAFISQQYKNSRGTPTTALIRNKSELENLFKDLQLKSAAAQGLLPEINFNVDLILLVSMGQKNTDGYKLSFDSSKPIDVYADHIAVQIVWTEPMSPPGQKLITHPCVLIKLPIGNYTRIKLYDQSKKLRHVANL